jgi:NAD(P)-dependent dehydrogenase (short-subunit alcohol dehydrogenase family)
MRFGGKTVLVTGGAMGIGAATVRRLAAEGATVIVADVNQEAALRTIGEVERQGGHAGFEFLDLTDRATIARLAEQASHRADTLHGLVCNAGITGRRAPVEETVDQDWEQVMAVNLRGVALTVQALLPLLKRGPGHIVNISSEGGFRPRANRWVYDASKAGICALTRTLACELIAHGIRVNTVAPGWTVTEMHFLQAADPAARRRELEDTVYEGAIMKRLARPEEIAACIAFLLSDDASFITATTLHVDGGRVAH